METNPPTDAEAFLFFLAEQVQHGIADKSPEELLQIWRTCHANAVDDIRRGVEDLNAGRFCNFEAVDAAIRARFGFSPKNS